MEELSQQDQEFVKEVALTGNATQAVKKAYKTKSNGYARVKASRLIANDNINTAVIEVKRTLAERIPDELLEEKHLALLRKTDEDGNIDVNAVGKGLDMGYKLKGAYAPDKSISLNVNADITNPKARELADKYEEELKKNL